MADPQHIAELDTLDVWTVHLYRTGLSFIALGFGWTAWLQLFPSDSAPSIGWLMVAAGTSLSAVNLHLYAKTIRWVMQMAAGLALPLLLTAALTNPSGASNLLFTVGLVLLFVPICGFALKEQFCFHLPGMRLLPLLLVVSLVAWQFHKGWIAGVALALAAMLYGYLALAKWRMPLHFDIGDKSKYQT